LMHVVHREAAALAITVLYSILHQHQHEPHQGSSQPAAARCGRTPLSISQHSGANMYITAPHSCHSLLLSGEWVARFNITGSIVCASLGLSVFEAGWHLEFKECVTNISMDWLMPSSSH
jgi:hypothetical protein